MEKNEIKKAKALKKKESDLTKPKRPTTAYLYYLANCRAENKRIGNASLKVSEFAKIYSEKWRNLSPDDRKLYDDMALKDRDRWLQETGKSKSSIDKMKPKRPQSAYMMFLRDYRKTQGKMSATAIISKAAEEWRILSDVKKKIYTKQFQENQVRYQQEKANYEKQINTDEVQHAKRPRIQEHKVEHFNNENAGSDGCCNEEHTRL